MKIAGVALLTLDALNVLIFAIVAVLGLIRGVSDPFPPWFANSTNACFYSEIVLCLAGLPLLASRELRIRVRAFIASSIAGATVMLIAFLTTRG
jgi:hypothetical protein